MDNAVIIGIHGLSNKPEANVLEKGWKDTILEGLDKNEKVSNVKINFTSIYWADVMYEQPDPNPDLYKKAEIGALKVYRDSWKDDIRKNISNTSGNVLDFFKTTFGIDSLADKVLELKLKDLFYYYDDAEKRTILRDRFKTELLKNKDKRIMVISHSMGTIIAYDVLREIGKKYPRLIVDHFITMGSPLGLPHVKYKIEEEGRLIRTPSIVRKWSNFSDRRDPVAVDSHLADDYESNDSGVIVKDDLVSNDWGGIHHKSYGYLRTPEVSKVIKNFI